MSRASRRGFTLIELMIVAAIIGILSMIAMPKLAGLIRKSHEGASKGNLGTIRSALGIYFGDLEGQYPNDLASLTEGAKYLTAIPTVKTPDYHSDGVTVYNQLAADDAGGWGYDNATDDARYGAVWVNCTHSDTRGASWSAY